MAGSRDGFRPIIERICRIPPSHDIRQIYTFKGRPAIRHAYSEIYFTPFVIYN